MMFRDKGPDAPHQFAARHQRRYMRKRSRKVNSRLGPLAMEKLEARMMLFKPFTHIEVGHDVLDDIQDNSITIEGQAFEVDGAVAAALKNHPEFYNAGVVGPDGFPDLIMGQGTVHPVNTGRWLQHVLDSAWDAQSDPGYTATEQSQILAWSYGYLTHAAGDMWAHTLVNEFATGVFPAVGDVLTDSDKAAIAVRHILVENYIGDATPGFDGNPDRTTLPNGDVSDDSTPKVDFPSNSEFAATSSFIYETLIVPQDPGLELPTDRGAAIDFFLDLRAGLQSLIVGPVNPLEGAVNNYNSIVNDLNETLNSDDCNFENADDVVHDTVACPIALGTDLVIGTFGAAADFVEDSIKAAFGPLFDAYLGAWIADIDAGLEAWGEGIGLRSTRALFDPDARRDLQNSDCAGEGPENEADRGQCESETGLVDVLLQEIDRPDQPFESYVNNHLLSMLGLPDLVGDVRAIFTEFSNVVHDALDVLLAPIEELIGTTLDPVELAVDKLEAAAKELIKDQIRERFGIDLDQIQDFFDRPSSKLGLESVGLNGVGVINLFQPGDRAKLDSYLGITGAPLDTHHPLGSADLFPGFNFHSNAVGGLKDGVTFDKNEFAAYANAVTTSKLLLLSGSRVDSLITELIGAPYTLYSPAGVRGNIMTTTFPGANIEEPALPTNPEEGANAADVNAPHPSDPQDGSQWLRSIDGDHAWRNNGQPTFPLEGMPAYASAGNGNFPLWESCLLRDNVFRTVFTDWENGNEQFPDLDDDASHDLNESGPEVTLDPVTGVLTILDTDGDDVLEVEFFEDVLGVEFVRLTFPAGSGYCAGTIDTPLEDVVRIAIEASDGNDTLIVANDIMFDVDVRGGAGNDTLRVDYTGGFDRHVTFDGGPDDDLLQLIGGGDNFSGTYDVGLSSDQGTVSYQDGTGNSQVVTFAGLEPIDDLVFATSLTINASGSPDTINITDGPIVLGTQTTRVDFDGAFEEDRFANKPTVTVNGRGREDSFNVDIATPAALLRTLNAAGGLGSDIFVVTPYDNDVQVNVEGGFDGLDRLIISDDGPGDLVVHRRDHVGHGGSVVVGNLLPVGYEQTEVVQVTPLNPVDGTTGSDLMGRLITFHQDVLEPNDTRHDATFLGTGPTFLGDLTIDPGPTLHRAIPGGIPGDQDWFEFRPDKVGIFRFELFFEQIATLANGSAGLPDDGNLDIAVYDANGTLITSSSTFTDNESVDISAAADTSYFVRVDGFQDAINVYDLVVSEIDHFGATVGGVAVTGSTYDLFDPKPSTDGPTPAITSLTISLKGTVLRAPGDLYPALDAATAENLGHYRLVGDHNGIIPIASVVVTNVPPVVGVAPMATIELTFDTPLPDDRFTLILSDGIRSPAGNRLDGESNANQPLEIVNFPSGDGFPGGDFVARFTVDTRAEFGVWAAGSVYVDTNGNYSADPENKDNDHTNEDITYVLGFTSDSIFAGNFAAGAGTAADGFDKLAAYGRVAGAFRWLIDTDNNGVPNLVVADPFAINGLPIAGDFDGNVANGDEVGLKNGSQWHLDTNHNFNAGTTLAGNMAGFPIVGDFDGDGVDDLGSWTDNTFLLDLSTQLTGIAAAGSYNANINGMTDVQFRFGFPGASERPIAADFDGDGIDDIGLWAPDRNGAVPAETAEWYVLITNGTPIPDRIVANPQAIGGNIVDFTPVPFGSDIYAQFGDDFALPVVGNFDPPVVGAEAPDFAFASFTNPDDAVDVNDDGVVTPVDALLVINVLNRGDGGLVAPFRSEANATGPYYDSNGDGNITPLDVLKVVNWLNLGDDSGEGEGHIASAMLDGASHQIERNSGLRHLEIVSGVPNAPSGAWGGTEHVAPIARPANHDDVKDFATQPLVAGTNRADRGLPQDIESFEELLDELAEDLGKHWSAAESPFWSSL